MQIQEKELPASATSDCCCCFVGFDNVEEEYEKDPDEAIRPSALRTKALYAIGFEFFERLAYYAVSGSLVFYFQRTFNLSNETADIQYLVWTGVCYFLTIAGGYVADDWLGRRRAILWACAIYLVGLLFLLIAAIPAVVEPCLVYVALYIIAFGVGGIKPNIAALGADQFDDRYKQDRTERASYFSWYYFGVNAGGAAAFLLVVYCCQFGLGEIPLPWGFFTGYAVAILSIVVATLILKINGHKLDGEEPRGSAFVQFISVCWSALYVSCQHSMRGLLSPSRDLEGMQELPNVVGNVWSRCRHYYGSGDKAAPLLDHTERSDARDHVGRGGGDVDDGRRSEQLLEDISLSDHGSTRVAQPRGSSPMPTTSLPKRSPASDDSPTSTELAKHTDAHDILDYAKEAFGGQFTSSQVESAKLITRLLPFLAILIPYWICYNQMYTTFQNQACQMNLTVIGASIPTSSLPFFNNVSFLILVPLFEWVLFPFLRKKQYNISMLPRIGWGLLVCVIAMVVAAGVEVYRMRDLPDDGTWNDPAARANISPCQNIDNYNPNIYQQSCGTSKATTAIYCHSICSTMDSNGKLSLDCIQCDDIPQMSRLSVGWQIPQFLLMGLSEVLVTIPALEFFYSQAPLEMRSMMIGLFLSTLACGSFLGIPLLALVNISPGDPWLPEDLNQGHLSCFFTTLAVIIIVTLGFFVILSRNFEYKSVRELATVTRQPAKASISEAAANVPQAQKSELQRDIKPVQSCAVLVLDDGTGSQGSRPQSDTSLNDAGAHFRQDQDILMIVTTRGNDDFGSFGLHLDVDADIM